MATKSKNIIFKGKGSPPPIAVRVWDEKKGLNVKFPLDWVLTDNGYIAHGVPLSAAQQIVASAKRQAKERAMPDPKEILHTKEEYAKMGDSKQMYDFYEVKPKRAPAKKRSGKRPKVEPPPVDAPPLSDSSQKVEDHDIGREAIG